VRLFFTFNDSSGLIENRDCNDDHPVSANFLGPNQASVVAAGVSTVFIWEHKAPVVILYVEPSAIERRDSLWFDFMSEDFPVLARRDTHFAALGQMFLALCQQWARPQPDFVVGLGLALAAQTLRQFRDFGEFSPRAQSGLPPEKVKLLTEYIDAHLNKTILARDLARLVALSPDHFSRRFKLATAQSPKQFVLRRQMERVSELLRTGEYNVTEAGQEVGFDDPSHLNRCFRKRFGCPPIAELKRALAGSGKN
jgi:AraC family transcriptional regulator